MNSPFNSLRGHTVAWQFNDGPTAGKQFEHRFNDDGTVEYRMLKGEKTSAWTKAVRCATERIADGVFAVSYLGREGYTLSAVLNFPAGELVAFASNDKEWFEQKGTFELVN